MKVTYFPNQLLSSSTESAILMRRRICVSWVVPGDTERIRFPPPPSDNGVDVASISLQPTLTSGLISSLNICAFCTSCSPANTTKSLGREGVLLLMDDVTELSDAVAKLASGGRRSADGAMVVISGAAWRMISAFRSNFRQSVDGPD